MFAKREEVVALQENINKKVNWTEYHNVLRKLADQRQYIETMAENVFGGRRDGLSAEFAKKADATAVAESLKLKADTTDVNEVRARLERLEVLVHNSTARHSDQLEEIRTLAAREAERESENLRVFINKNADTIQKLSESNGTLASRLHKVERVTDALEDTRKKISDEQAEAHRRQDALMDGLKEQREKIGRVDEMTRQTKGELQSIGVEVRGIRDDVQQRVAAVTQLVDTSKSRLDFLMQANETMKRKAKETNKSTASKIEVLEGEQVKLAGQFAVLEKTSKKFERDLSKVERQQLRDITCGGGATNSIQALMTPNLSLYDHGDVVDNQNMRLKGIMDQLEQIGASGNPFDHMGIDIDPKRPPLPWTGDRSARGGILDMIPKQTSSSIDSARSAPPLVAALAGEIKSNSARSSPRSGLHQSSPAKTSASSRKRRN
jgi:chromosome segregation ATPase